jgi:RNA polymerase sigma-70 factor, ECF subfamily
MASPWIAAFCLGYLDRRPGREVIADSPMISERGGSLSSMDRSAVADQGTVGGGSAGTAGDAAERSLLELARAGDQGAFEALVEPRRAELRAYCYRMLGSVEDADDAVQNALLRAWRGLAGFEGRSSVRSWLYSIATNAALDIARGRSRRELPTGFGPAGAPGAAMEPEVADPVWLEPYPDQWLPQTAAVSPEARYELRESVELAFMIMLQRLPPLQRAALILRDVLGFPAAEAAAQLGTSTAAVNSALQRARAAARDSRPERSQQAVLRSVGEQHVTRLAQQYADAMEAGDVDTLLGMLTEDATWSMPPIPTWFRGHDALRVWLVRDPMPLRWRHRPTMANGQLAIGGYLYDPDAGDFVPHVVDVLTLSEHGQIAAVTAFFAKAGRDRAQFFAAFGLPPDAPNP